MPDIAKVLKFPAAASRRLVSSAEAQEFARQYLGQSASERSDGLVATCLNDADVVLAILAELRELVNVSPGTVAAEAIAVHSALLETKSVGLFDERDYFLGDAALLAGSALRLLGRRDEAELWLDRSEASFRHVVNSAPGLANIAYARLTLHYDCGRFERALELLPSLAKSFVRLGMMREALKCQFLEGMSLRNSSRTEEAWTVLDALAADPLLEGDHGLHGLVLLSLGDLSAEKGETISALEIYQSALPFLQASRQGFAVAHLKGLVGETLRAAGNLPAAVESFRSAISDYAELEMVTWVAYLRIVLAETLIALSRNREAEWEIRMALPTVEAQKMVPEGFAALRLLRESLDRRETNIPALSEIVEHMKASR